LLARWTEWSAGRQGGRAAGRFDGQESLPEQRFWWEDLAIGLEMTGRKRQNDGMMRWLVAAFTRSLIWHHQVLG
jgi:hypothetical protein